MDRALEVREAPGHTHLPNKKLGQVGQETKSPFQVQF